MAKRMPHVGDRLGRYLLTEMLGRGGMGTVFEARDDLLERSVAVKVINPAMAEDEEYRERFRREAVAMSGISSPNIVAVHDHGDVDGNLFLVTQLVDGGDLGQLLRRTGPMQPGRAIDLTGQVLQGLADAHAAGIVHRDVKPSNVLLSADGSRAFLCDFGIATSPGGGITRTGALVGSLSYMAPERHSGETAAGVGPASDVYAVGCLLWELLTGTPPYAGTDVEIALGHIHGPLPQLPGTDGFSVALNGVLARSLAKDPAQRYRSARAMRADLMSVGARAPSAVALPAQTAVRHPIAATTPPAPPAPARAGGGLRSTLTTLLAVAAVVVAAIAVVVAVRQDSPGDVMQALVGGEESTSGTPSASTQPGSVLRPSGPGADRPTDDTGAGDAPGGQGTRGGPGDRPTRGDTSEPSDEGSEDGREGDGGAGNGGGGGGPTQQAPAYTCWDGSGSDDLYACGYPTGLKGVAWVFPGFPDLPCHASDVPNTTEDIEYWQCPFSGPDGGSNSLNFVRWTSHQAAIDRYSSIGGRDTWLCGEDVCGTSFRGSPGGKPAYARIYNLDGFWSITIRAETSDNRSWGFDWMGRPRDPDNLRGVPR